MNKAQLTQFWQDLPWNEIKQHANKYLPKFISIVLIVLIAQTFAELTWQLFTDEQDTQTTTIKNQVKSVELINTAVSVSDLNDVAAYHLFGDAKKPVVVQQQVIDAPETRLKLELKGVLATTNASEALAIISSSKDKDKTYHIGDKVIGGALLHAVYADRIILKRNGRLETLRLPKPKVDSKAFYSSEPATESNEQSVKRTSQNNVSVQEQLPGMQVNQSQNQRLKNMRDTLINEPEKIWEQVRINPVMNDGKVQGYTLSHDDQDLMTAMNIRNTDVITGINGHSLSDPATLYGLMNTLSEQQSLELTVQRNGQEQTIQLSF